MSVVPEWIPIFTSVLSDDEILKPTYAVSVFRDGRGHCKLCESTIKPATENAIKSHVSGHRRELRDYRKRRAAEAERKRNAALAAARAEKAMEKRLREERG